MASNRDRNVVKRETYGPLRLGYYRGCKVAALDLTTGLSGLSKWIICALIGNSNGWHLGPKPN